MGHRRHVFVVSLALLLLVATTHAAGGHANDQAAAAATGTEDGVVVVGSMGMAVGSSPPSCHGKCGWWPCVGGSCKAVLVPIEPPKEQYKPQMSRRHGSGGGDGSRASPAAQRRRSSSYDNGDHADYKPITWECKCVVVGG